MRRVLPACAPLALLALLIAVTAGGPAAAKSPTAYAAHGCGLTTHQQRHLGTTYVYSLRVKKTKCKNGRKVAKSFNKCRHSKGKRSGRCHSKVYGYSCSDSRYNKSPFSYDSKVACTKGSRRISFKYTQNT